MLDRGPRREFVGGPGGAPGGAGPSGPGGPIGPVGPVPWAPLAAWAAGIICVASAPATAVVYGNEAYVCVATHVAGVFATDLAAGRWIKIAAKGADGAPGAPGASGADGRSLLNGAGAPGSGTGNTGDFYVDTTNSRLYGPKASGTWPGSYVSQIGPSGTNGTNGAAWYAGSGAPGTIAGAVNGDWYLNTANGDLYRMVSGAWVLQMNLTTGGVTSASATPPVRQTVSTGPRNTDGTPSFLPASTTGTLTLTAQNVSVSVPLGVTAAQGFGATPNATATLTSNPSWTLSANATNILFLNGSTGGSYASTLVPIYQYGGTISTVNGQFTFDRSTMTGYLGNGSTAVATPLVAVGQAVTNASAVTSTIAYAYNGYAESAWTSGLPSAGGPSSITHNLGVSPDVRKMVAQCTSVDTNINYAVGDILSSDGGLTSYPGTYSPGITLLPGRLATTLVTGASGFLALNKASGGIGSVTASSWQWKIINWRGW